MRHKSREAGTRFNTNERADVFGVLSSPLNEKKSATLVEFLNGLASGAGV